MRSYEPMDRTLIDLRDERDHLNIRISLFKDSDQPDQEVLFGLQRELEVLDRRIDKQTRAPDT
jgi:hypothetical protein